MFKKVDQLQLPIHDWIFENVSDAIIFVDQDGYIVAGNQFAEELLEVKLNENDPLYVHDYIDLEVIAKQTNNEDLIWTKTNPEKLVVMKSEPVEQYWCYTLKEGGLKSKKDSLIYTLNHARSSPYEGIIMHDRGQIIDCDFAFASMIGYKRSELVGKSIFDIVHADDHNALYENMQMLQHDSPYPLRGFKRDGSIIYAEVLPEPFNEETSLRVAIVRNITERVENEKQIEFMAYYDQLTDLPNRNYFQLVLEEELKNAEESGEQLAVHFIDVDYFKHINDTLGYQVGDSLLKGCASRLKQMLREDLFIARMTSDEFLVLQRKVAGEQEVRSLAEQVIDQFRKPLMVDGYEIYTTVSIGISRYPESAATTASELIEHADSAMHVIKEESRNDYQIFKQSLKEGFKERFKLETELHKALKDGDFELHFQPQYDLKSQEIIGFEALCRWPHKEMGAISPDQFIPIAEKTGLILDIGDWVIYEACRLNKKWQGEGLPKVKVSVNLSARQFLQRHLVSRVSEILEETGLEPQYLELEITESMAMSNERYIIDTLNDFNDLGVKVALDDFGTGYSSLKYLSQFPLSKIKIDRMFIQNQTKQNMAIVKTIIHLSHALNLKVIAEGVEKETDLDFLLSEKCDQVQGFYFSKPMPESQIKTFLNE
ncbi:EAL domain-containing protein [Alkalibacillus haloalkaliphilus]|uniref:GGDEF domain-containing protein n=1 Tax=Alkalibacillus haloalkaliphilus TaxID=94136 RepID=A0A511W305_9BACI|nr:EAL domain-containing protein [Alkalibacillus haloalkaliphilus]GEN45337.1 hypothetical protein AHA02nite_11130 [Alkalibacillus haloalkaliphilus]